MLREAARVFGSLPLAARVARVRAILLSLTHIRPVCAVQPRLCGDAGAPPGGGGGERGRAGVSGEERTKETCATREHERASNVHARASVRTSAAADQLCRTRGGLNALNVAPLERARSWARTSRTKGAIVEIRIRPKRITYRSAPEAQ